MKRSFATTIAIILLVTLTIWLLNIYMRQQITSPAVRMLLLFGGALVGGVTLLAAFKDVLELVEKIFTRNEHSRPDIIKQPLEYPMNVTALTLPPYHKLPQPEYVEFVGRLEEIGDIVAMLRPYPHSQFAFIAISGVGGIGKSALALEIAQRYLYRYEQLAKDERFEAIIWSTAKNAILTASGIVDRSCSDYTLDEIYKDIAIALKREDITRSPENQVSLVYQALSEQRSLLILDNLESIDHDEVIAFLHNIPAPTKVIVTTRVKIDATRQISLERMLEDDALHLLSATADVKQQYLDEDTKRRLIAKTSGVPLAIVWSVARLSIGYLIERVLDDLSDSHGDLVRYCFEAVVMELRTEYPDAHKLLLSLSLFANDASRDSLGLVADLSDGRRDDGLVILEKVSLVNRRGGRFSMLAITRIYVLDEAANFSGFMTEATARWSDYLVNLVRKSSHRYWIQDQETILAEGENFIGLLEWSIDKNDEQTFLKIVQYSVLYLQYTGRRTEARKLAGDGQRIARELGDMPLYAWLCVDAGWILSQAGEHREAVNEVLRGKDVYLDLDDPRAEIFADCVLAQVRRQLGEIEIAYEILMTARDRATALGYVEGTALAHYELGKLAREAEDWAAAYSELKQANVAVTKLISGTYTDIFALAIQGNFGTAAFNVGEYEEARSVVQAVLQMLESWRVKNLASNFTARMYLEAARIESKAGDVDEARRLAQLAKQTSESTNDHTGMDRADRFIESLKKVRY